MTNQFITFRLDPGGGLPGSSAGSSLQGEVPTPMGNGSGMAGMSHANVPTPHMSMAVAEGLESLPTPISGGIGRMYAVLDAPPEPSMGSAGMGAKMNAPPEPSMDFVGAGAVDGTDGLPRPSGEPKDIAKSSGKR